MSGMARQVCRCTCSLVQNNSSGWSYTAIRQYRNPQTAVFERMHEVGLVQKGKYPLLKKRHYLLKNIPHTEKSQTTMNCILTEEVEGIGLKGTMVEVRKTKFRKYLYPMGLAVYASPENLELYGALRKKSAEDGITYEMKQLMQKMSKFHLQVFMNPKEEWTLTSSHLRIAFRKMGVMLSDENILMAEEPVTKMADFLFRLQLNNRITCQLTGTVFPIGEDGLPPPNKQYPPIWNKSAKDSVEYIVQEESTETKVEEKETASEQLAEDTTRSQSETTPEEMLNNEDTSSDKPKE